MELGDRSRRDSPLLMSGHRSRVALAIAIGMFCGCVFAFLYPHGLFAFTPTIHSITSTVQLKLDSCKSSDGISMLKLELVSAAEENAKMKNEIRKLTKKLWLAQQGEDNAQKQVLVLGTQHKAGPFRTVKSLRTNAAVIPDKSVNPRLAKILEKVAVKQELIVALANSKICWKFGSAA